MPHEIFDLGESFVVELSAADVHVPLAGFAVFLDDVDVTALVGTATQDETIEDADHDGIAERYHALLEVFWNQADPAPGQVASIRVQATTASAPILARGAANVRANVSVTVSDKDATRLGAVNVLVDQYEVVAVAQSIAVEVGGQDMTSLVAITGPVITDEILSESNPNYAIHRYLAYTLDLSALGLGVGAEFEITATVASPLGVSTASAKAKVVPFEALDPFHAWAIELFVKKLELTRNEDGSVRVGATAQEIKDAADQLRNNLAPGVDEDPGNPDDPDKPEKPEDKKFGESSKTLDVVDGDETYSVEIDVGTNAGGESPQSEGQADSGTADVVVALGGNGNTSAGKKGSAKNSKKGGLAVAVGGNSDYGQAGTGSAEAAGKNKGTAVGIGGTGDDATGGEGGDGTAKCSPEGGTVAGDGEQGGYHMAGKSDGSGKVD